MDDLIVIIMTLIIAGFGVLGQIKKKKESQQPEPPQNEPDDIWGLFQPQRERQVQETGPFTGFIEEPESSIESFNTPYYRFDPQQEGASLLKDRVSPIQPESKKTKMDKVGFSLKKAVIFSEILNRKYV
jgi:hypothetical protein